jgi:hypothetical protein
VIEVHDRACSANVAEHADAVAKADAPPDSNLGLGSAAGMLVHLV